MLSFEEGLGHVYISILYITCQCSFRVVISYVDYTEELPLTVTLHNTSAGYHALGTFDTGS
jgi:hypothetical protein